MGISRRTVLKGMVGAAAAAFCPALVSAEVMENGPRDFAVCRKSGWYRITLRGIAVLSKEFSCYEVHFRSGKSGFANWMLMIKSNSFHAPVTAMLSGELHEGERVSVEQFVNGARTAFLKDLEIHIEPAMVNELPFSQIKSISF